MKRIYLYFISCIMVVTGLCTSCDAQLEQMNPNKATEDTSGRPKLILNWL